MSNEVDEVIYRSSYVVKQRELEQGQDYKIKDDLYKQESESGHGLRSGTNEWW